MKFEVIYVMLFHTSYNQQYFALLQTAVPKSFSDLAKTRTVSQIHHDYCLVVSERMEIAFPAYSPIPGCKHVPKWVAGSLNSWANEQLYNLL